MGPKKHNQQITEHYERQDDQQPQWAKRMEERITSKFDDLQQSIAMTDDRVTKLEKELEEKIKKVERYQEEREFHDRKLNLLIFGLEVKAGASGDEAEQKVRDFFNSDLELDNTDPGSMLFQACHPLPSPRPTKPVIVRFVKMADRERVLRALPKLKGKKKPISVRTDLPPTLRQKRAELEKKRKELRADNSSRVIRVVERGQMIQLEEKKSGAWVKID